MTVSTTTNSVIYRGNGAATDFAVPFKVLDEDHLVVRRRVFATGVFEHTYIGTDYSYNGLGESNGTLTLAGTALDDDYELVIERIVPYTQDLDIVNSGGFYPETVEEQLDLIVMSTQQLDDQITRTMLAPPGETIADLPIASVRAEMYLGFDENGDPVSVEALSGDAGGVAAEALLRAGHDNVERTQRIAADEALDARIDLVEDATLNGFRTYATWADLEADVPATAHIGAIVTGPDAGTHDDPINLTVGVDNEGTYSSALAPVASWERLGDTSAAISLAAQAAAEAARDALNPWVQIVIDDPLGIEERNYEFDISQSADIEWQNIKVYPEEGDDGVCDLIFNNDGIALHGPFSVGSLDEHIEAITETILTGGKPGITVTDITGTITRLIVKIEGVYVP